MMSVNGCLLGVRWPCGGDTKSRKSSGVDTAGDEVEEDGGDVDLCCIGGER